MAVFLLANWLEVSLGFFQALLHLVESLFQKDSFFVRRGGVQRSHHAVQGFHIFPPDRRSSVGIRVIHLDCDDSALAISRNIRECFQILACATVTSGAIYLSQVKLVDYFVLDSSAP